MYERIPKGMAQTLLVFDIDDTLTQTAALHINAFIDGLKFLGVQEMDTNFGGYLHHTDSYISRIIFEQDRKETFSQASKNKFEDFLLAQLKEQNLTEIEGASKLLKELKQNPDIAIAFATGSLLKPALLKLEMLSASYEPLQLVASNHIEERENIVATAIEQAKEFYAVQKFSRIISIGDGLWDLKTASNLGIEFIGIGKKNEAVMKEHGMKRHFSDLTHFKF